MGRSGQSETKKGYRGPTRIARILLRLSEIWSQIDPDFGDKRPLRRQEWVL
jgi:hypothetical protein